MKITRTETTITATECGRYNQTIIWNVGKDNLWHMEGRVGGTRPGWAEEKVFSWLSHAYN